MNEGDTSGDSRELEALFDSIASGIATASTAAPPATARPAASLLQQLREGDGADDSDELQALFDSVRVAQAATIAAGAAEAAVTEWRGQDRVFQLVGQMARQLHDTLGQLGYSELLESTVSAIPDTRERLNYVATLTEQAACRVLNATDIANPLQEQLEAASAGLARRWDALFSNQMAVDDFRLLAEETRSFLKQGLPAKTEATKAQLLEIMMAQDFQDLTGQVIKKIIQVAQELETQLMQVLIETLPGERRTESVNSLLNGPVINPDGRADVVASQQQVDELLGSLGF
ncbi:MAG: chemotaxis regulator CheZ [Candidatus Accumulibacter sp. BA-94]|jgi:chemotaxis protein CheZ|uniref:protein phosphatase CheZ n=1 Tax=Accumulibacter sp. TaxID=2053492 RepID=UPI000450064B|nr:protein phosphatase CheZ [Accumulibacter sp.]EXI91807.1 MAG: chemotaxis regulator CheZ [Candidatus Accumulibacter sp. BA-94]MBL8390363.1 protein phosphatase CheZ [Accumulibacter sp.]HRD86716.1 protein phosphatase CheZ [Accumulibacter sp.]